MPAQGPQGHLLCPGGRQHLPLHLRRCGRLYRCLPLRHHPHPGCARGFHRHLQETWAAADFFVIKGEQINSIDADEIVTEIQVPALTAGTMSTYLKFAFRKAIDFPLVSCAAIVTSAGGNVSKASIVMGGVFNSPKVATDAQTNITGKAISAANAEAAGAATAATATAALPANKYKVQIAKTLIKRALLATA